MEAKTRSDVIGSSVIRTPTASLMAFAMAAATGTTAVDRLVGSAKAHRVRCDLLQCDMLFRHSLDHHLPIPKLHVFGGRLQHLSRDSEDLVARVTCRCQHR